VLVAGMVVAGILVGALAALMLSPSRSIPSSRLVAWQLHGYGGPGFDATTAETTRVIRVAVAQWPADSTNSSWLAAPVVTYTPSSVTITLHTSDAYEARTAGKRVGFYDTGGWVEVALGEPLGGRALFDGSRSPAEARPYR
jgi:hypothetical protein